MSIVDVGLVYGVTVDGEQVHVLMTMTSAACPVTDVIVDDVEAELDRIVPPQMPIARRPGLGSALDHGPDERAGPAASWAGNGSPASRHADAIAHRDAGTCAVAARRSWCWSPLSLAHGHRRRPAARRRRVPVHGRRCLAGAGRSGACVPDDLRLHRDRDRHGARRRREVAARVRGAAASALGGVCLLAGLPMRRGVAGRRRLARFHRGERSWSCGASGLRTPRCCWPRAGLAGRQPAVRAGAGACRHAVPWWFSFLVMTIAAERLEMTRLDAPPPPRRCCCAHCLAAIVLAGSAASFAGAAWPAAWLYGALAGAAGGCGWSLRHRAPHGLRARAEPLHGDLPAARLCLARRVRHRLVRDIALGLPWRDAALHALGLGFIFSMMMGHAPVILPAHRPGQAAVRLVFYVPLAVAAPLAGGAAVLRPRSTRRSVLPAPASTPCHRVVRRHGGGRGAGLAHSTQRRWRQKGRLMPGSMHLD